MSKSKRSSSRKRKAASSKNRRAAAKKKQAVIYAAKVPAENGDIDKDMKRTSPSGRIPGIRRMCVIFLCFFFSMLFWELFLYRQIHGTLNGFTLWNIIFLPAEAMFFTFLTGWLKEGLPARICRSLVLAAVWTFYLAQLIYFRIFGSMFSVSMVGMAGDAVGNFGWALMDTVKSSVGVILLSALPVIILVIVQFLLRRELQYAWWLHFAAFILVPVFWFSSVAILPSGGTADHTPYGAYHSSLIDTDTASSKIGVMTNTIVETINMFFSAGGRENIITEQPEPIELREEPVTTIDTSPNILEDIDFASLAGIAPDDATRELCEYLQTVEGTKKNEYSGLLKDYNLIYICAESFSNLALDENATPTLYRLAHEGIVLNNYYNSFRNTTINGEYAFLTGLWPDVSRDAKFGTSVGSFAKTATHYMPYGLGNIFSDQCKIQARGYHNYLGSYYIRNETLPNLGFECKFMGDGMHFTSSWPSSDLEMMQQSVDDYINDDRFCAYYMTFSGHGPYSTQNVMYNRNIYTVRNLLGDRDLSYIGRGYIACNYELEKAISYLMQRLEETGKLENTLIVLTGDHYPYYVYDEDRDSLAGHHVDTDFELYKSTCIMWAGGLDEPIEVDTPCCNVDILPTVLNLLGLRYDSRMIAGKDIFSTTPHCAALYNRNFITSMVMYNNTDGSSKWLEHEDATEQFKESYLNYFINQVKNRYSMSLKIEDTDFYRFVWNNTSFRSYEPDPEDHHHFLPELWEADIGHSSSGTWHF